MKIRQIQTSPPLRNRPRRLSQDCIPGVKKLKSRIRRAEKGGGGLSGDSPRGGREKRRLKPLRVERISLRAELCVTFGKRRKDISHAGVTAKAAPW